MSLNYPRYEIIVVDNAPSSSATADLIASAYRDGPAPVRYLRAKMSQGWAEHTTAPFRK